MIALSFKLLDTLSVRSTEPPEWPLLLRRRLYCQTANDCSPRWRVRHPENPTPSGARKDETHAARSWQKPLSLVRNLIPAKPYWHQSSRGALEPVGRSRPKIGKIRETSRCTHSRRSKAMLACIRHRRVHQQSEITVKQGRPLRTTLIR